MKIKELVVKGLFGRFDYEINFLNKKLLIITAPNGYGKSTLLKIIKSFVDSDYIFFINENFESIEFTFDNNKKVFIKKVRYHEGGLFDDFFEEEDFDLKGNSTSIEIYSDDHKYIINAENYERKVERFERMLPVTRLNKDLWMDDRTSEVYSFNEMLNKFKDTRLVQDSLELPSWLINITTQLNIEYISTNRLLGMDYIIPKRNRAESHNKLMVDVIAGEIKDEIDKEIKKQFNEGRKRETSFPTRLMEALEENEEIHDIEIKDLITQIQIYESKYLSLDIVPDTGSTKQLGTSKFVSSMDQSVSAGRIVLKTYLNDVIEKFKLLDDLAKKLTLFSKSINDLMSFKKLSISSEKGFVIMTYKSDPDKYNYIVPLSSLSSGEQHLLVLIGKLIFSQKNSGLILIDEPEISLHPEWQESLLDILSSIQKISNFEILIATHSPILIGDRWDDVIELRDQVVS